MRLHRNNTLRKSTLQYYGRIVISGGMGCHKIQVQIDNIDQNIVDVLFNLNINFFSSKNIEL